MINKFLQNHYNRGNLYGAYLINTDDLEKALQEVHAFIIQNVLKVQNITSHPDYCFIKKMESSMKNISIDQIRGLKRFLNNTSMFSGRKIAVIYEAENMSVNASHCCLKMLEEPSCDTQLFLLTQSQASIIPTIKSRCIRINAQYNPALLCEIPIKFIKVLIKSSNTSVIPSFMQEVGAKDRILWHQFSEAVQSLLAKFCKHLLGHEVHISHMEAILLEQFQSSSLDYIANKYHKITQVINDTNEFDIDHKSSCSLIISYMSC